MIFLKTKFYSNKSRNQEGSEASETVEGQQTAGMSYRSCLDRLDHAIDEARLGLVVEEQMATVLETNVLVGGLHLHVGPLVHDRIADLVLHSVHDGYRNTIDLRQID